MTGDDDVSAQGRPSQRVSHSDPDGRLTVAEACRWADGNFLYFDFAVNLNLL